MVQHEGTYRLSQPLPLGTALMLLAKCPVVAEAFTLKIWVQSRQSPQLAMMEWDSTFLCVFSLNCSHDLQGQPWAIALCCKRWNSWISTRWWPKHLPRMFSLICGKLGFGWPSHIIPMRFYLYNLLACLFCSTVFAMHYLLFCCRVPSLLCQRGIWGSFH